MRTLKVSIENEFHNKAVTFNVRNFVLGEYSGNFTLSKKQTAKFFKETCGIAGCQCHRFTSYVYMGGSRLIVILSQNIDGCFTGYFHFIHKP